MPIPWHLQRDWSAPRSRIPELILEGGRVTAEGIRRSGDIWANAIAQAAGGIGDAIQRGPELKAREEERRASAEDRRAAAEERSVRTSALRRQEEDQETLRGALESGKARDEILAQTPGHLRAVVQKHWDEADERANKLDAAKLEYIGGLASSVLSLPPELRAGALAGAVTHMRARRYDAEATEAEQLAQRSPQEVEEILKHYARIGGKAKKPIEVSPGATLYDETSGKGVFTAPPKPDTPNVGSFEDFTLRKYGAQPTPEQIVAARREYQQADDRPRDPVAAELARLRLDDAKKKAEGEASEGDLVADAWAAGTAFPSTQAATSAALASFKRRGMEAPRKLSAPMQTEAIRTADAVATIADVRELYEKVKGKIGPVTYTLNEWSRKIPGVAADPDFVAFNTMLRSMGNLEIKRITGAQMSEAEADRLLKGMATGTLKPGDFEAALGIMERNATRNRDILLYGKAKPYSDRAGGATDLKKKYGLNY